MMKKYESYKDSGIEWIGEMPEYWEKLSIRRITKEHKQGYYSPQSYTSYGFRLIRITDLDRDGNIDISSSPFVKLSDSEEKIFKIRKGDFLFPRTGSIGLLGVAKQDMDAVFASYLICFRFTHNAISSFMKFYFMSDAFLSGLLSDLHGGVNQNIHAENIKDQFLGLPSISEQKSIANYLAHKTSQIDNLIQKKQQMIALLEEEKIAVLNETVTRGLNPDAPMKDSGIEWIGMIPEHWEVKKLKYICSINPSKSSTLSDVNEEQLVTFLPMEKVSESGDFKIDTQKPIKDLSNGFTFFQEDDVIVAKITPCFENGKGAYLRNLGSRFGFGSTEFHVLRGHEEKLLNQYLYYVTKSNLFMELGEASMTGAAGQKRVPTTFLQDFLLPYPSSLEEQVKIVDFIERKMHSIGNIVMHTHKEISLLQEYRTALISEAVTGKIDVRDYQPEQNLTPVLSE